MSLTLRDLITPDYPAARAEDSVVSAVKQMVEAYFGAVPIVDADGVCQGVLGAWDVARLIAQDRDLHKTTAGSVVRRGLTLTPDMSIEQATAITASESTPLIPVVDDGAYAGILTRTDLDAQRRIEAVLGERTADLVPDIAPRDEMLYGQRGVYYSGGAVALSLIRDAMKAAGQAGAERILDLPCGHGRVMRMLKAAFPGARLTACDLSGDGVNFCAVTFGAEPVYAPQHPRDLTIEGDFDLIWVGSLFTHLDRERWEALLDKLVALLAPAGLLVFTTLRDQGATALRGFNMTDDDITALHEGLARDGFAYRPFTGEYEDWGITLNTEEFVRAQVGAHPGLHVVSYAERAWAPPTPGQDVVGCVKAGG